MVAHGPLLDPVNQCVVEAQKMHLTRLLPAPRPLCEHGSVTIVEGYKREEKVPNDVASVMKLLGVLHRVSPVIGPHLRHQTFGFLQPPDADKQRAHTGVQRIEQGDPNRNDSSETVAVVPDLREATTTCKFKWPPEFNVLRMIIH